MTRIYRDFSDEELLRRWRSGSLTEAAQKTALAELTARGIRPPPVAAQPESTAAQPTVSTGPVELATVATFSTPFEAHVLRAQLEAEGLFAVVADEHLVGTNQLWRSALGGVRVQVGSEFLAQAKEIMAATQEGAFNLAQDEDAHSPAPKLSEQETALLAYAQAPYWLKVWQPLIKKPGFLRGSISLPYCLAQ